MKKTLNVIEFVSEWTGKIFSWAILTLVLVLSFEVFMRYALDRPTIFSYEVACSLGITITLMGLAYTQLHHGFVRVDIFWRQLSSRGKGLADVIGSMLFFFPLVIMFIYFSAKELWFSWSINEVLSETYFYPPAWPVKAVMLVGFLLFLPQGLAQLIRDSYLVIKNKPLWLT